MLEHEETQLLEYEADSLRKVLNELEKKDKIIDGAKSKLEEHIKFCEQEASGHINNRVCHISLRFDKNLLDILKGR